MGRHRQREVTDHTLPWERVGALVALALVLGYLESFVPLPIPGVKLGLANIAILVALYELGARATLCVCVVKVLAVGLLFGNPLMIAYSALGSLLALGGMAPLSRLRTLHPAMTSVVGGILHELGQLCVAWWLLGTSLVWYGAPPLLVVGALTGGLTGILAGWVLEALGDMTEPGARPASSALRPPERHVALATGAAPARHAGARLALLVAYAVALVRLGSLPLLLAATGATLVACLVARVRPRLVARGLVPLLLLALLTSALQVATVSSGLVLASLGPVLVTSDGLAQAAAMTLRILAITLANVAFASHVGLEDLVPTVRRALSPLDRLGFDLEGPLLALSIATGLAPLLADDLVSCCADRGARMLTRTFWQREVASRVARAYLHANGAPPLTASRTDGGAPDDRP